MRASNDSFLTHPTDCISVLHALTGCGAAAAAAAALLCRLWVPTAERCLGGL
jgi:hypothetical protein